MNYLYNGVEFPALPEWDKTVRPYAVIRAFAHYYFLYLSKSKPYHTTNMANANGAEYIVIGPGDDDDILRYGYNDSMYGNQWKYICEDNGEFFAPEYLTWTNTDIYTEDGTLYLAASEPVPVSTIPLPPPDPLSMLLGWRVGSAVRSMRR